MKYAVRGDAFLVGRSSSNYTHIQTYIHREPGLKQGLCDLHQTCQWGIPICSRDGGLSFEPM